ncbi:hypothetical protein [Aliiroseovarius sp. 2305UL8-7]|uniref:hypothetical protein n=1 Tax=Aliiroseovarius conchicola TaxID=3121637 RepID=UPI0035297777
MTSFGFTGVISGPGLEYTANITDMAVANIGSGIYLYTTSGAGGGAMVFSVTSAAIPSLTAQHGYTFTEMSSPHAAISFLNYSGQSNFVAYGRYDWTLDGIAIGADGSFGATTALNWGTGGYGFLSAVIATEIDGTTHVYGANARSNGFNHYTIDATNTFSLVETYSSGGANPSADIVDMLTIGLDGQTILVAACQTTNCIKSYLLDSTGTPTEVTSFSADAYLPVAAPNALVAGQVAGQQYVVLASAGTSSLTVLEVHSDGTMKPVDHVIDSLMTRFSSVTELASVQVGDRLYVVAGGADDGLSLFVVAPNGQLVLLDTVYDTHNTSLQNISALSAAYVDGDIRVFASSETEAGITSFEIDLGPIGQTELRGGGGGPTTGTGGNDILGGASGHDVVQGLGGDDILLDGAGIDTLTGGSGRDVFVLSADDMVDTITDFDPGVDRIDLSGYFMLYDARQISVQSASWGATLTYRNEVLHVHRAGGGSLDASHFTTADLLALNRPPSGFRHIPEVVNGTENADILQGDEGTETFNGMGGDDLMLSSLGADIYNGGDGQDTVSFANATESVLANLTSNQFGGAAAGDVLNSIENLAGSDYSDTLGGTDAANVINGNNGNDTIFGYGGDDVLNGGGGNDIFHGGAGADHMAGGNGNDTASYALSGQAVQVSLTTGETSGGAAGDTLTSVESLDGSNFGDVLVGNATGNTIHGRAGNDLIEGHNGADKLYGGNGNDLIEGGTGNDLIKGGDGNDELDGGDGADILDGGSGQDSATYRKASQGANVHLGTGLTSGAAQGDSFTSIETLIGSSFADTFSGNDAANLLRGWEGDDSLDGGGGNDRLEGGAGDDHINGGAGNDALFGESGDDHFHHSQGFDHYSGGTGLDTVDYSTATWRVTVNLVSRQGGHAGHGDSYHSIESVIGGAGNDDFTGTYGDDRLAGNGGNDLIKGNWGNDILYGDAGHDFLLGGVGHDVLYGGAASDTLWGQSGNDTLDGGPGGDVLDGGAGRDTVSYASFTQAVGVDLSNNYTWGAAKHDRISSFENITGSSSGDQLYGDGIANAIFGGAGNDLLYGRRGADMLFGQDGNDTLRAGPGGELFAGGTGFDTVVMTWNAAPAYVWLTDGVGAGSMAGDRFHSIENLLGSRYNDQLNGDSQSNQFFGSWGNDIMRGYDGDDFLFGEGGGDWLFGNDGNDYLNGGPGTDRLFGGSGNDTYIGGSDADHFVYVDGMDNIRDFDPRSDRVQVHAASLDTDYISDQDILSFGEVTSEGAYFDFGNGDTLLIDGIVDLGQLEDSLLWI